ncbi:helix-turn-helix domain-containing protein [Lactococcus lactis]|uniref:XRE family transcriptional regulator n=1 Tax=Lactococcus lactis TaxID=1358 RepID=UPI0019149F5C|nr:helix-turn-helix domain-containing protein [Lactococcus lactis]MBK5077664.1 helix-turn-helix domain-containing protein [Lactococcus lactis]
MNFSERLKSLRLEAGYTQSELAKIINLASQGAYGKYEQGLGMPQRARLEKLADLFGVSIPYLLGQTDERTHLTTSPTLSKRLKDLRFEIGYTQKKLAEAIDCSPQVYLRWENGTRRPKTYSLEKLAQFFHVPVSYLLCETDVRSFSELDQMLEHLPESHQRKAMDYVKNICEQYKAEQASSAFYSYDVLNMLLLAGRGREIPKAANFGRTTVYWNKQIDYDVAMWIKGDSMMPAYSSGDVALIKKQTHADYAGQVCAVNYDGNTYIKKVYKQKTGLQLVSINKKHQDFFLSWSEKPWIIGKVIESFTPIEKIEI